MTRGILENDKEPAMKTRNIWSGIVAQAAKASAVALAAACLAGCGLVDDIADRVEEAVNTPRVVAKAARREAARQNNTWTSENIQKNPYLFIQDQIRNCDELQAKIEAQTITMVRLNKQSSRMADEAESAIARYTDFLEQAKTAYKAAEASGAWPVVINGYKLDEDQLADRIADALEGVELARKKRDGVEVIARKTEQRKELLKAKKKELVSLRSQLVQQGEEIKMNAQLAEIKELSNVLTVMKDMMLEIDDPAVASLEDLTAEVPKAVRKRDIRAFLDD